jgi:hypothetical protein
LIYRLHPIVQDARLAAEAKRPLSANPYTDELRAHRWEQAYRARLIELEFIFSRAEAA